MNIIRRSLVVALMFCLIFCFYGCSNATSEEVPIAHDEYIEWQDENILRITIPLKEDSYSEIDKESGIKGLGELELSDKYLERTKVLQKTMHSYFLRTYNIDISEKLEKQKLRAFKASGINAGVMGYVDPDQSEYLNLNESLFGINKDLFDNTYVHETLHQIGFISKNSGVITEGIVDALTDLILQSENIVSYPTEIYGATRILGYQILTADSEIVNLFLNEEKPDITARIDQVLKKVNQPLEKINSPGKRLENLLNGLTYGMETTIDSWYIAFEAQEIVRSYCQELKPKQEEIEYIKSIYLVEEYESTNIQKDGERYLFLFGK